MKPVLLYLVLLLACIGSAVGQSKDATVELSLDKRRLSLPCPNQRKYPEKYRTCPDGPLTINVGATVTGRVGKKARYEYSTFGGKIVGSGPKIIWDMSGARPGTYTVTATVYKGTKKFASSTTKTITVEQCADCTLECLDCPSLQIMSSRETVSSGEMVEFWLPQVYDGKFHWEVAGGEIVSGQDTDHVTVRVRSNLSMNAITVTAQIIDGGFCFDIGSCPDRATLEVQVSATKPD